MLSVLGWQLEFAPLFDASVVAGIGTKRGIIGWLAIARSYLRRVVQALNARHYDLVWIEKETFPFLPAIFERIAQLHRVPYIVDFDDAIFHNYDLSPRWVVRRFLGRRLDWLLQGAALVTAGNSYLANYAAQHGAVNVANIPSTIDLGRYHSVAVPDDELLRIGWIGSLTTTPFLTRLFPALEQAAGLVPFTLVTVGAAPLHSEKLTIEQHEWNLQSEADLLGSIHVGIMPLADSPWERGKCAYKLIQYMGVGRPVIASPIGANCDVVTPKTGILAADTQEWTAAIVDCHANRQAWAERGRHARSRAEAHYSVQAIAPRIAELFAAALHSKSA